MRPVRLLGMRSEVHWFPICLGGTRRDGVAQTAGHAAGCQGLLSRTVKHPWRARLVQVAVLPRAGPA